MMSKGFIVGGSFKEDFEGDYEDYDFQIEDQRTDPASVKDGAIILEIDVPVNANWLALNLDEAKAFAEAMQEIIGRYDK